MTSQYAGDTDGLAAAWMASGVAGLTGRVGREPLGVPRGLVDSVLTWGAEIGALSGASGRRVDLDWLALLGERAAIVGLGRRGSTSCGGAARLLPTGDGWLALSLARDEDVGAVPAWLELDNAPEDVDALWRVIERELPARNTAEVVERLGWLGLPGAALAEASSLPAVVRTQRGDSPPLPELADLIVVDLSALWAGPLCAHVLGLAGARVIKVESLQRPDGARRGPKRFFDMLHHGHESVAFDFTDETQRCAMAALIDRADVVIEASRPRALEALGIDRARCRHPRVWLSITAHGRSGEPGRTGFGDDAAVGGGLVAWDGDGPCFVADAVADPLTGLACAREVLAALSAGGRWFLDVALAGVAASVAVGPAVDIDTTAIAEPRARPSVGTAARIGSHTVDVLAEFSIVP